MPPSIHSSFRAELQAELHDHILSFWRERMVDRQRGGFYGRLDGAGRLHPQAAKGVVLNARILWSFAAAARYSGRDDYRRLAERAYAYLHEHFADREQGGVYWLLDCEGSPLDTKKQIYAQAFTVYALAEYYRLGGSREALDWAVELYGLIERYSRDRQQGGYLEAFDRDWGLLADLRLSEQDANEAKTMNTHLHLLEAYTNLYRAWPDGQLHQDLLDLIDLFLNRFIDPQTYHLHLFFDEHWKLKSHTISFGHDIEAAWLLTEAAALTGEAALIEKVKTTAVAIAAATLAEGVDADGGLFNEAGPQGLTDTDKHWWPQAEAMVGFWNAWELSGEARFTAAARRSWGFIREYLVDRAGGEWRWGVRRDGAPMREENKAGPWKAPYHNTRACLEMIGRLERQEKL